jgi:hypothetical protein
MTGRESEHHAMVRLMNRFIFVLALAAAGGCGHNEVSSERVSVSPEPVADSLPEASAFRFDEANQIIYLDTQIAPGQGRRFDIGQGSITIETLHVDDNELTFHYTPEV